MRIRRRRLLLATLVAVVVGLQISYPLLHGVIRTRVTVAIVCVFALTCVTHAALSRGPVAALRMLAVTAGLGFAFELVGVSTGVPFGGYAYANGLGPQLAGVPLVVALAWTMLAWPAALAARRLVAHPLARIVVGAWALASADLFLDPQLVAVGAWRWLRPSPHLPGVPTVPLTNYAGWLLAGLVVSAAVQAVAGDGEDGPVIGLYLWLYGGWTLALSVFLGLPAAAAWGAAGMGLVAVPLAVGTAARLGLTRVAGRDEPAGSPASAAVASPPRSRAPATPPRTPAAASPGRATPH